MVRRALKLRIDLMLAVLTCGILGFAANLPPAKAQQVDRISLVQGAFDSLNRHDVDALH